MSFFRAGDHTLHQKVQVIKETADVVQHSQVRQWRNFGLKSAGGGDKLEMYL